MSTLSGLFRFLLKLYADSGYQGPIQGWNVAGLRPDVEIVKRSDAGQVRRPAQAMSRGSRDSALILSLIRLSMSPEVSKQRWQIADHVNDPDDPGWFGLVSIDNDIAVAADRPETETVRGDFHCVVQITGCSGIFGPNPANGFA